MSDTRRSGQDADDLPPSPWRERRARRAIVPAKPAVPEQRSGVRPPQPAHVPAYQASGLSWSPWRPDILALLQGADILDAEVIPDGSNYSFLVRFEASDGSGSVGIYKPQRGEAPLYDFPSGTLYQREVAAYYVSTALGWDLVPPTVIRDGPHGVGMAQVFIETPRRSDSQKYRLALDSESAQRLCLFDIIINNADRKAGHCLIDAAQHVWGIDHGLTFHRQNKLRTVIWNFAGEPIADALRSDVQRLLDLLTAQSDLCQALEQLITQSEISAVTRRVQALLSNGHYPEPPSDRRSIPWPPF